VDASPEHLRPGFDGGTRVRTVGALASDVSTHCFEFENTSPNPKFNAGTG